MINKTEIKLVCFLIFLFLVFVGCFSTEIAVEPTGSQAINLPPLPDPTGVSNSLLDVLDTLGVPRNITYSALDTLKNHLADLDNLLQKVGAPTEIAGIPLKAQYNPGELTKEGSTNAGMPKVVSQFPIKEFSIDFDAVNVSIDKRDPIEFAFEISGDVNKANPKLPPTTGYDRIAIITVPGTTTSLADTPMTHHYLDLLSLQSKLSDKKLWFKAYNTQTVSLLNGFQIRNIQIHIKLEEEGVTPFTYLFY